jgi:spermidine/putrescine transport system substrate-binding protein
MAGPLFEAGKLQRLDHSLLPNIGNIEAKSTLLSDDPEMRYSIPYTGTITGIGYNRNMVSRDEVESWAVFANKRLEKRMTMLNDSREVIGAALKFLGYSLNSTNPRQIEDAGKIVREWKDNIAMFDVVDAKEGLQNGTYAAIQAYSGDVAMLMAANPDIAFSVPREGAALNADVFVIASDSEQPGLAHAFINHFLDAEAAKNTMLEIKYFMPNTAARQLMDEKALEGIGYNLSPAVREKCEVIHDLDSSAALYDAVWEEILFDDVN